MRSQVFIILFLCFSVNLLSQNDILIEIMKKKSDTEKAITKRIKKKFGKETAMEYKNILFIPFIDVSSINLSSIKSDDQTGHPFDKSRKKNKIIYFKLTDRPYYQAIIYNDSLDVLGVDCGYICQATKKDKALVEYFLSQNADLLFYGAGIIIGDYYIVVDNKVYRLFYDKKSNTFSKEELKEITL